MGHGWVQARGGRGGARPGQPRGLPLRCGWVVHCFPLAFEPGDGADSFQDDAVGGIGGKTGRAIVGGRDLDNVHADQVHGRGYTAHGAQELDGGEAARLRRAGAGGKGGVQHVYIHGEVDVFRPVLRLLDGIVEDGIEAALLDLRHLMPAHALPAHPVKQPFPMGVAAQPHLNEVLARNSRRFR